MTRRREESVTLMVVALATTLAAWSIFWMGLTGGSLVAWHLAAICVGRSRLDPFPLAVLVLPSAVFCSVLADLSAIAAVLPLALGLTVSSVAATSEFLPGRLAGGALVLFSVALVGSLVRPIQAAWSEAAVTFVAVALIEVTRSGWHLWRMWRRPADALGGYGA